MHKAQFRIQHFNSRLEVEIVLGHIQFGSRLPLTDVHQSTK